MHGCYLTLCTLRHPGSRAFGDKKCDTVNIVHNLIPTLRKVQDTTPTSAGGCVTRKLRIRGLAYLLTFNWLSATVSTVLAVDRDAQPPEQGLTYVDLASTPRPDCLVAFRSNCYKNHSLVYHPFVSERRSLPPELNVTVCAMGKGGEK